MKIKIKLLFHFDISVVHLHGHEALACRGDQPESQPVCGSRQPNRLVKFDKL